MEKNWYQSRAVLGSILVAAATALGAVGAYLNGTADMSTTIATLIGLGQALGIFGIRNALD